MYCTPTSGAASSIGTSSEGIGWQKRRDLYAVCGVATAVQQPVFVPASDGESRFVPPATAAGGGAGVSGAVGAGGSGGSEPAGGAQSPAGGPHHQKDVVQNANWEAGTRKNTGRKKTRRRIGGVHLP